MFRTDDAAYPANRVEDLEKEVLRMKVNVPWVLGFKNPWFWVGVASVAITAIGVDPQTFTSWAAVWNGAVSVLSNPI